MLSKFIGSFHLSKNLFIYFNIEHNYGHHKYVATPEDPVTARKNETFYSFLCLLTSSNKLFFLQLSEV